MVELQLGFPLYHGSSTHHLAAFARGQAPRPWPHKETALALLRDTWAALAQHGRQPEWWVQRVIDQEGGHANWRHGVLYATPSKRSAVNYASGGSAHGGELLTLCSEAVTLLRDADEALARMLVEKASSLAQFLNGGGEPILVEISAVTADDLTPERNQDDVPDMLKRLSTSEQYRQMVGQQINFAIKPGCGAVTGVLKIRVERPGDPVSDFELDEIL